MVIELLRLSNFRNYEELLLEPAPGLNVLVGDNAQGKTNLLEAIYLLGTTKSFRAVHESEAVRSGCLMGAVAGRVRRGDGVSTELELTIQERERKTARIHGAKLPRPADLLGYLQVVFFGASDLRLVHGEPAVRRRFMNLAISQTSSAYWMDLAAYRKVLAQRNSLLRKLREAWTPESGIEAWDAQLVLYGSKLILRRKAFAAELGELARQAHRELSGGEEELSVRYTSSPRSEESETVEEIQAAFQAALSRAFEEEVRRGTSLAGPQRDDLKLRINDMEARTYGSQGQQRTVVLSLKLAELQYLEAHTGEQPVLLLDDVMSDLDDLRRARLLERAVGRCQVFLTCTNLRSFPQELLTQARVFQVRQGKVSAWPS